MIFHPILAILAATMSALYALLPAWTFGGILGAPLDGAGSNFGSPNGDGGAIRWFLQLLFVLDRYLPIHDALLPIVSVTMAISLGLVAFKVVKFILSLVPTISAAG